MNDQPWTVEVDEAVCEGNAVCVRFDSSVFELHDEVDVVMIKAQPTTDDSRRRVEMAVRRCPKGALRIVPHPNTPANEITE